MVGSASLAGLFLLCSALFYPIAPCLGRRCEGTGKKVRRPCESVLLRYTK